MRKVMLASVLPILMICPCVNAAGSSRSPDLQGLQLVAQLPAELPQRVMGFAYDGEKFWASIYLGRGRYATLNPSTLLWKVSDDEEHHKAIRKVSGAFGTPGAISFQDGKLWVGGAYGGSFGSIDTREWKAERIFIGKQRADSASQSYASMAHDGTHLWIAWHWFRYNLPVTQTQLLLKVEPDTGKVVGEYPAPAGTSSDGTHALTWDGSGLWHAKGNRLSSIDPATGRMTADYILNDIKRPSGLAWDGHALWIAEFDGKVWRLPF